MKDDSDQKEERPSGAHDPSRRRFFKGVGIAGAGAAIVDTLGIEAQNRAPQARRGQSVTGNIDVSLYGDQTTSS